MMPLRPLLAAVVALVATSCGEPDPDTTFLARAVDHELTVESAAQLLAPVERMETPRRAALALANLWVDFTLLATAAAEDTAFGQLDLEPVVEREMERAMAVALQDSVRRVDAPLSDTEIDRRFRAEADDSELRARQILIRVPAAAPPSRHDSAREALEELRRQIVEEGASFEEVAREHSQDPRSTARGGDLGFFGPGDMVPPFDSAARALEPGELSEPVRTAYGWHLIRLEERRTPTREAFAERVRRHRNTEAVLEYLEALEERAAPQIRPNALSLVRQLAGDPEAELPEGTSDTLVSYTGGAVTVEDARRHFRLQPRMARQQMAAAPAERFAEGVLRPLVRQDVVGSEARRQGLEPSAEEAAAAGEALRQQLQQTARDLGLLSLPAGEEEGGLQQAVRDVVQQIVRNERSIPTLGPASQVLRNHYSYEIRDDRTLLVARRLEALRGQQPQAADTTR